MGARVAVVVAIALAAIAALLFGLAGRLDWTGAWVLLALTAAFFLIAAPSMMRRDPDLIRERLKAGGPAASGDAMLMHVYRLLLAALLVVAALDAGRYRWSHMPVVAMSLGAVAMIAGFAIVWWCSAANAYLSSVVRIQADRGHRVVDTGPYAYVRHPMYAGLIALIVGMALLLGSWLALVPAVLIVVVLAVRIRLEERLLSADLDGYTDYKTRVTARLVPRVW